MVSATVKKAAKPAEKKPATPRKKAAAKPVELEFTSPEAEKFIGKEVFFKEKAGELIRVANWGASQIPASPFLLSGVVEVPVGYGAIIKRLDGYTLNAEFVSLYLSDGVVLKMGGKEPATDVKERVEQAKLVAHIRSKKVHATAGSDPEFFAESKDGQLIPSFEFLGPKTSGSAGYSADIYWDGYQGEMAPRQADCLAYHVDAIAHGIRSATAALTAKFPGAKLSTKTTFDIPPSRLSGDEPKYVEFGCRPSLNVYGETFPPVDSRLVPYRSSGGHLHFSFNGDLPHTVRWLDRILGVLCVSLFQRYDEPRRRVMYGRAGEYRKTPYGFEYRTLSSAWMICPATTHMVFELARRIMGNARDGDIKEWLTTDEETRECINNCDVVLAQNILRRNDRFFSALLASMSMPTGGVDRWKTIIFDGVHTVLRDPDSYSAAWGTPGGDPWIGHSEGQYGNFYRATMQLPVTKVIG
jgi:hypothetical protein